jgi:hypothetical protein
MNFDFYIVKGSIATPENPYFGKFSEDPVVNMDIMISRDEFEEFAKANTIPCINVPNGRYHKDELDPIIGFTENGVDWRVVGNDEDYGNGYERTCLIRKSSSPEKLIKLSDVVKVLEDHAGLEIDSIIMSKIKSL